MPQPAPPAFVAPMSPTLADAAPEGAAWVHEIKYDGYRTQLAIAGKESRAYTRNGFDWTEKYIAVVTSARALKCRSAVIDGEMCVQDETGLTSFSSLRRAIKGAPGRLVLFAFDLLTLDGRDLRGDPLVDRRRQLEDLLADGAAPRLHFSSGHVGEGPAFFRAADRHGLEGIVSKRADSRYIAGRSKAWLKIKSFTVGDFSVLGIERSPTGIPVALLVTPGQDPAYVGDAMITLKTKERDAFWTAVERLGTPRSRLAGTLAKRKASWVKEGLFARVRHLKGEDKLRHATVQSVGTEPVEPDDVDTARHPEDE